MGTHKYIEQIKDLFSKSAVLSFHTISRSIKKGTHKAYAKQLVYYLMKKSFIHRLTKGWYTTRTDPSLSVFAFQPAYLGLQSALSAHGLWEQETIPIILTTKHIRQGLRTILGGNVLLKRIMPNQYFGIQHIQDGNLVLPYSTIEKTLLDMIVFKQPISKEVIRELRKRIDTKLLKAYLKEYDPQTRKTISLFLKKNNCL